MDDLPVIALSPATAEDSGFVLALRNAPETRRWSFSTDDVPEAAHQAWYAETLMGTRRRLFIATQHGLPVGYARLDPQDEWAEVSIAVVPALRGRHLGRAILEVLVREAAALGVRWLRGRILEDNHASRAVFWKVGFTVEQWSDGGVTMIRRVP